LDRGRRIVTSSKKDYPLADLWFKASHGPVLLAADAQDDETRKARAPGDCCVVREEGAACSFLLAIWALAHKIGPPTWLAVVVKRAGWIHQKPASPAGRVFHEKSVRSSVRKEKLI
jgi:hypothetical protein